MNETEVLTVGDLRRMLHRWPDNDAVVVEVDTDGRRVCLYGDVAVWITLHAVTNMENDHLL